MSSPADVRGGFDASRATRRWTVWLSGIAVAWGAFAWFIGPVVIRSAYSDGMFGFLGRFMSGRGQHPVDRYLGLWSDLALRGLIAVGVLWLLGAIALQPATWRFLRSAWSRIPTFGGRVKRLTSVVVVALVAVTIGMQVRSGVDSWQNAEGYEYEQIAIAISEGEGFSFPPQSRWLYLDDEPAADEYGATAWKEPVYPYFIAGWFETLGPRHGRIAIVVCQVIFLIATGLLVYMLGCRLFGPVVGTLAALGTMLIPELHAIVTTNLQVQAISALLLVAGLFLLYRYGEDPGPRFAAGIGVFLGLAALTHAVLIVLVPIAGLFVFLYRREGRWGERLRPALLLCLVAAMTISPWTIRNYMQFGHLIPVQTGFGLFANVTTPYLAETYEPEFEACGDGSRPVFQATGPYEALMTLRESDNYTYTWQRGVRCVAEAHAGSYGSLNEHERDGLHRAQLVRFIGERPAQFLELTGVKALVYLFDVREYDRSSTPLAVLGIAGAILVLRRRRMWLFPAALLAYSAPFILTAPLYYRYRAPLTPLLTLLAVVVVWRILERPLRRVRAAWGSGPQ